MQQIEVQPVDRQAFCFGISRPLIERHVSNIDGRNIKPKCGQVTAVAPATTGDPMLERYFRVQQNTLERMAAVLPAMWLFAFYVSPLGAAGIGLVFFVGRIVYLRGYVADPAKRGPGFGLGVLAEAVLLLGALGGAAMAWLG